METPAIWQARIYNVFKADRFILLPTLPFPPDDCQMSHQTSVNPHQTSVRQVPHIQQTCTICQPDIYCTRCVRPGVNVILVWQMSVWGCQVSVGASENHLTGSTRQIATVWRKRWSKGIERWMDKVQKILKDSNIHSKYWTILEGYSGVIMLTHR